MFDPSAVVFYDPDLFLDDPDFIVFLDRIGAIPGTPEDTLGFMDAGVLDILSDCSSMFDYGPVFFIGVAFYFLHYHGFF